MARDKYLDSLKFILVSFVVWGHIFERNVDTERTNLIGYGFLGIFVMPLFIFISGYLSKNITWGKYKISFVSLMGAYILFQTIYTIPRVVLGTFVLKDYLFNPIAGLWYIIGLLVWRFVFSLIQNKMSFLLTFSIFFILSIAIGFSDVKIPYSRILVFFPFFILGYYCPAGMMQKIRDIPKIYTIAIVLAYIVFIYFYIDGFFYVSLFGEELYSTYPSIFEGVGYRVGLYVFGIIISACMINLLATEKFYKFGSSSLIIYLLHPFLVQAIYFFFRKMEHSETNILFDLILAIIVVSISLFLTRFKVTQYLVDPVSFFKIKKKTNP